MRTSSYIHGYVHRNCWSDKKLHSSNLYGEGLTALSLRVLLYCSMFDMFINYFFVKNKNQIIYSSTQYGKGIEKNKVIARK